MKEKISLELKKSTNSKRWKYVILGIILMMLLGTVYSYSVFRLAVQNYFEVDFTSSGLPYMASLAFYSLFMFVTGRFIDRFHPRSIMIFGSLLVALGWILSAFAPNIYVLTLTYGVISGAGVGIAYGVPMTVVARWFPEKKGFAVGLVLVGFGLSPLITAPLARTIVELVGLTRAFLILGAGFAVFLPVLSYFFEYPELGASSQIKEEGKSVKVSGYTTKEMIKDKSFKGLYINFIIGTTIGLMLVGMTTSIGVEYVELTATKVTMLMTIFAIFNGMGRPTFGWLTDRLSPRKAMLLSYILIISAALVMVLFGESNLIVYIIGFAIFWFNLGGWLAIAPASTMNMYGTGHYSQNYGLVFTAYGIGAVTGVITSGMLIDAHGNYKLLFYYIIALCLVGIFSTLNFIKPKNA